MTKKYTKPDLHMHSNISDGSDTPSELLQKVREAGLDVFALTDHDSYLGCDEIFANLKEGDPMFIAGIEISCEDELGCYHILGYCYDVSKSSIVNAVEYTHNMRRKKVLNRFRDLEENHNLSFTEEEKNKIMENENPGKPHFISLLIKKGYANTKEEAWSLLNTYRGSEVKLRPEEGIEAIQQADGIPVLAHGILGDGGQMLSAEEMDARVKRLKEFGLMGLECYYSKYTEKDTELMLSLAEKYNLMVTAGSDYHGKRKPVNIGETGEADVDAKRMERFYRTVELLLMEHE